MEWLKKQPISHRGLHSSDTGVPENSLLAFQHAINENYTIELDVHLLADGEIAVFHDDNLERMCGANVLIQDLTTEQLKSYKLLSSKERIPLLPEVLDIVKGQVPILVEIKNQKRNGLIQETLYKELILYKGDVAVQSFNPFLLKWFVQNAPLIPRGQLSSNFNGENVNFFTKKILQNFLLNFISQPHFIAYNIENMPNKKIAYLRAKGLIILCWTVKKDTDYKHLHCFFDNIIFEGFKPNLT